MKLNNIIDRIKLPFRKEKELFSSLYEILGFYPHNIEYYKMALMHKSIRKRNDKGKPLNNERLEFLGDAILDAAVGYIVYRHYEGKREGFLTNTRSKLVSRETLGKLATEMRLSNLLISAGHSTSHNSYVEGNAFEALVGAIYLDRGYEACLWFFEHQVLGKFIDIDKVAFKEVNFKSKLLEWSQKNRVRLEYKLTKQKKDENGSPVFTYMVIIEGVNGESGSGYSKKEAQQKASKDTLQRLKREPQFVDAVFAAKTARTQMEEEPAMAVPDPEKEQQSFIIEQPAETEQVEEQLAEQPAPQPSKKPAIDFSDKEFDLSDISHKEKSREEIIAEAEAAAFAE
ncbi:MAG: ribonuclease III [Prevotella ruminicola]|uniref:Ribonuclease 3 n=1 Tax=Xylanibacter ruminicola TaxID=839 RepID=A0A9D5S6G0_XYLRU|nr:ribonuclease III [Xylanibacter ruminicola]